MTFPTRPAGPGVRLREIAPDDEPALQAVFAAAEDWFVALTGDHALPGDVQSLFWSAPEGVSPADKVLLVVEHDGEVAGVVDLVPGHPEPGACSVGLFLLAPAHRGRGVGTAAARSLLDLAGRRGISRVTVAVPAGWDASATFLSGLGFTLGDPFTRGPASMVRARLDLNS